MCLLRNHRNPSLIPRTQVEEKSGVVHACDATAGEAETGGSLGLNGQPALPVKDCLNNSNVESRREGSTAQNSCREHLFAPPAPLWRLITAWTLIPGHPASTFGCTESRMHTRHIHSGFTGGQCLKDTRTVPLPANKKRDSYPHGPYIPLWHLKDAK